MAEYARRNSDDCNAVVDDCNNVVMRKLAEIAQYQQERPPMRV